MSDAQSTSFLSIREIYCPTAKQCCRFDSLTPEEKVASAKYAHSKVVSKMKNLYFWGYPVNEVMRSNFFENLSQFFCANFGKDDFTVEIFSTLTMFALYQDKTSRIIQAEGYMDGQPYQTDWVEFCHHELWYAVGYGIFGPGMGDQLFRACDVAATIVQNVEIKKLAIIKYNTFWESTTIKRLNYLLRDAKTSRFLLELCYSSWSEELLKTFYQLEDYVEIGQPLNYVITSPDLGSVKINQARINALMRQ